MRPAPGFQPSLSLAPRHAATVPLTRRPRPVLARPVRACLAPAAGAAEGAAPDHSKRPVVAETAFADGRYGPCSACEQPVVIPGLSHQFCAACGWVERPAGELPEAEADDAVPKTGHHN